MNLAADEVQIVKDLRGLGVPRLARGRLFRIGDEVGHGVAGVLTAALRQQARTDERAEELERRGVFRRLHRGAIFAVEIARPCRALLRGGAGGPHGRDGNGGDYDAAHTRASSHKTPS